MERALERLIDRHGEGNYLDCTLKLTFPSNPNGVYLLKGGGPDVWRKFGVPQSWRRPQGFIHGKRCGVTENIGATARRGSKVGGWPGVTPAAILTEEAAGAQSRSWLTSAKLHSSNASLIWLKTLLAGRQQSG